MAKTRLLRQLLAGRDPVRLVGAHDCISAVLGERAGFEAVWSSGLGISAAHGVPDASILTMSDYLAAAAAMDDACALPVVADCDTGFGDVNNVIHAVRSFEGAGIAGICIEDKVFPKRNSFLAAEQTLADVDEFSALVSAAKSAQRDADFVVIARVEALVAGAPLEDALDRADAYSRAGADVILIHSKAKDPGEIFAFAERWSARPVPEPLAVVPTTYPHVTVDELARRGVKIVIYANQALRASVSAMERVLGEIASDGTTALTEAALATVDEVFQLTGTPAIAETERWFAERVRALKEERRLGGGGNGCHRYEPLTGTSSTVSATTSRNS